MDTQILLCKTWSITFFFQILGWCVKVSNNILCSNYMLSPMQEMQEMWFDPWVGNIPWSRKWYPNSNILAWKIPWTEVSHSPWLAKSWMRLSTNTHTHTHTHTHAHTHTRTHTHTYITFETTSPFLFSYVEGYKATMCVCVYVYIYIYFSERSIFFILQHVKSPSNPMLIFGSTLL